MRIPLEPLKPESTWAYSITKPKYYETNGFRDETSTSHSPDAWLKKAFDGYQILYFYDRKILKCHYWDWKWKEKDMQFVINKFWYK